MSVAAKNFSTFRENKFWRRRSEHNGQSFDKLHNFFHLLILSTWLPKDEFVAFTCVNFLWVCVCMNGYIYPFFYIVFKKQFHGLLNLRRKNYLHVESPKDFHICLYGVISVVTFAFLILYVEIIQIKNRYIFKIHQVKRVLGLLSYLNFIQNNSI